jgi:hypothetical protein
MTKTGCYCWKLIGDIPAFRNKGPKTLLLNFVFNVGVIRPIDRILECRRWSSAIQADEIRWSVHKSEVTNSAGLGNFTSLVSNSYISGNVRHSLHMIVYIELLSSSRRYLFHLLIETSFAFYGT